MSQQFQKLLPHNHSSLYATLSIRVKQELTISVLKHRGQCYQGQGECNNWTTQRPNQSKPCYFCGNPFTTDHRKPCQAREATCSACKKKGQFPKVCNTQKRRVNRIQQEDLQPDQECDSIDVDGDRKQEYGVMAIDVVQIYSVELLRAEGGKPKSLSIQLRSGNSFSYAIVDTDSPISFLNKRTADILMMNLPDVRLKDVSRHPVGATNFDYKKIKLFGFREIPIASHRWKIDGIGFLCSRIGRKTCWV